MIYVELRFLPLGKALVTFLDVSARRGQLRWKRLYGITETEYKLLCPRYLYSPIAQRLFGPTHSGTKFFLILPAISGFIAAHSDVGLNKNWRWSGIARWCIT